MNHYAYTCLHTSRYYTAARDEEEERIVKPGAHCFRNSDSARGGGGGDTIYYNILFYLFDVIKYHRAIVSRRAPDIIKMTNQ